MTDPRFTHSRYNDPRYDYPHFGDERPDSQTAGVRGLIAGAILVALVTFAVVANQYKRSNNTGSHLPPPIHSSHRLPQPLMPLPASPNVK